MQEGVTKTVTPSSYLVVRLCRLRADQLTCVIPEPKPLLFAGLGSVTVWPALKKTEASTMTWCAPAWVQVTFQDRDTDTGTLMDSVLFSTVAVVELEAVQSGGRLSVNLTSAITEGVGPLL